MNGGKGYISVREASCRWGVSGRRGNQHCAEGRISGVSVFGRSWAIPEDAEKLLTRASRDGTASLSGQAPDGQPSAF